MSPAPKGNVTLTGLAEFVAKADPGFAANAMRCVINQTTCLLKPAR